MQQFFSLPEVAVAPKSPTCVIGSEERVCFDLSKFKNRKMNFEKEIRIIEERLRKKKEELAILKAEYIPQFVEELVSVSNDNNNNDKNNSARIDRDIYEQKN